jgi:RND family efflux transporter MFP subunit
MKHLVLIMVATFFLLSGCTGKIQPGSAEVKRPLVRSVKVTRVPLSQVDTFYETSGTVKAANTSMIASRVMGTVLSVKVREGERVRTGQVLMVLDDRDMAQKVNGAEAGHKDAQGALDAAGQKRSLADITYQRYGRLYSEKVISRQEMDQLETGKRIADIEYERAQEGVKRTKAALDEAQVYHGFTRITAPLSGVVTEKKVEEGTLATPGMPLLVVEDTSRLRVDAFVDERLSGKLASGTPVSVMFDAIKTQVTGKIAEIVPAIDPATRTYLIKIPVQGPALRSGLYGRVLIPEGKKEAVLIPPGAIVQKGQLTGVYAVDDKGVIAYRLIRTGKPYDGQVEVLSGIKAGDSIIVEGVDKAVDGGVVK